MRFCSHLLAKTYFMESFGTGAKFRATRCGDWESFRRGDCNHKEQVNMGFDYYGRYGSMAINYSLKLCALPIAVTPRESTSSTSTASLPMPKAKLKCESCLTYRETQ